MKTQVQHRAQRFDRMRRDGVLHAYFIILACSALQSYKVTQLSRFTSGPIGIEISHIFASKKCPVRFTRNMFNSCGNIKKGTASLSSTVANVGEIFGAEMCISQHDGERFDKTSAASSQGRDLPKYGTQIEVSDSKLVKNSEYPLKHVAYIVDGNGRWATRNNKTRIEGHNLGANVTIEVVKESFALGVEVVTLYLFSTENWKRSNEEILNIMFLLEKYLRQFSSYLKKNNIKVRVIGQKHKLSNSVQNLLMALETSKDYNNDDKAINQRTLCLAVSYGGRDDIVEAARKLAELVTFQKMKLNEITEDSFSQHTMTGKIQYSYMIESLLVIFL